MMNVAAAAAAAARANGSPPPRSLRGSLGSSTGSIGKNQGSRMSSKSTIKSVDTKASSSSSMVSTPPDEADDADVQVRDSEREVLSDVESANIFGSDESDDERAAAATEDAKSSPTDTASTVDRPIMKLELPPPIPKKSPRTARPNANVGLNLHLVSCLFTDFVLPLCLLPGACCAHTIS